MRIEFAMEGGLAYFPALAKPVTVDLDLLSKDEAIQLMQLIDAARFFDLPAVVGATARGAADYHQYTITIDDGSRRHTVRALDPVADDALQALIQVIQKHVKTARAPKRGTPPDSR